MATDSIGAQMKNRNSGISLIELMVVVAIVGILASIAYPSYRQYVIRSNRTEAKVALMEAAQGLEKCFTRFMTYADFVRCPAADQFEAGAGVDTSDGNYRITGNLDAATPLVFTLTATPQGGQANDADCGNFTLDQTGGKTVSGTKPAETCW